MDYLDLIFYRLVLKLKTKSNADLKRKKAQNLKKKKIMKIILTYDQEIENSDNSNNIINILNKLMEVFESY